MDLNQVTSEKELGITFQDDLQFTKHLVDEVKMANSILGLIHRSFQHIDNEMLIHLYKALVRPHVEYASSVWSPFKLRDIKLIEGVQIRATGLSRDLRNEPYNIRLTTLGLPTLQFRRERADYSRLFTLSSTGLRGHSLKLTLVTQADLHPSCGRLLEQPPRECSECTKHQHFKEQIQYSYPRSSIQVLSDMVYANHPHPTTTNAHLG